MCIFAISMKIFIIFLTSTYILFSSCSRPSEINNEYPIPHHGFELLPIPDDNKMSAEKIALGRKLFFDPILSSDSSISCGSCHFPERAFTDGRSVSMGVDGRLGTRNAPTLFNVAYHPYFFAEGGNPVLETQMLGPLETHEEMDFHMKGATERLSVHPVYQDLFEDAFPNRTVEPYTISRAIAAYERSLLSGNSAFDQFYYFGDSSALSSLQQRGWQIFEASCTTCHSGFMLTNFSFENVGLYEQYVDYGRMRITRDTSDWGKVKTPSLRNIALTAPYMHDGSINTLMDVVEHYNKGGNNHPNKSPFLQPLNLSETDKLALEAFLNALTDTTLIGKGAGEN